MRRMIQAVNVFSYLSQQIVDISLIWVSLFRRWRVGIQTQRWELRRRTNYVTGFYGVKDVGMRMAFTTRSDSMFSLRSMNTDRRSLA